MQRDRRTPQQLVKAAVKKTGSLEALCAATGHKFSTLWRIATGKTKKPQPRTIDAVKEVLRP